MSETLTTTFELLAALASLLGAFLFLASAIGLLRLPDFYCRVHSPTKAATLGVAFLSLASLLRSFPRQDMVWIEDLVIVAFLFITVPVSSQMLMRAAATRGVQAVSSTEGQPGVRGLNGTRGQQREIPEDARQGSLPGQEED